MEKGDLDNALKFAEKAFAVAPNVANVVDTYSQILLKKGEMREALNKAVLASELSNGEDIDIQLNHIETLLANGRRNEATKLLQVIMPLTNAQKEKSKKLLQLQLKDK